MAGDQLDTPETVLPGAPENHCVENVAPGLPPDGKIVKNVGYIIIGVEAFALMGFDILTLLGAASIIGVAVGFASQTSLSNIISGLFLVGESRSTWGI